MNKEEWKKQKFYHAALSAGLLFLIAGILYGCINGMKKEMKREMLRKEGQIYLLHPELESELVAVFEKGDIKEEKKAYSAGENLAKKYGYEDMNVTQKYWRKYGVVSIILCIISVFIYCLSEAGIRVQFYNRISRNLEDISDYLGHFLEGDYRYRKEGCSVILKDEMENLGNSFYDLKQKLNTEKEKTKALVTDLSHQLKTPLASLKMSYEIMESEQFNLQERKEFLKYGKEEITKLQGLITALIQLSRMETGMIILNPVSCNLKETILGAIEGIYIRAVNKNITIETEEFQSVKVIHDSTWTKEALVNLLDNAVKYSVAGSTVSIRVTRLISYVLIEIEDEGIGIDRKDYSSIFKRFYRGKNKQVKETEGAGVGLYLVKSIIEEQGGTVMVKEALKGGSIFCVTLPLQ